MSAVNSKGNSSPRLASTQSNTTVEPTDKSRACPADFHTLQPASDRCWPKRASYSHPFLRFPPPTSTIVPISNKPLACRGKRSKTKRSQSKRTMSKTLQQHKEMLVAVFRLPMNSTIIRKCKSLCKTVGHLFVLNGRFVAMFLWTDNFMKVLCFSGFGQDCMWCVGVFCTDKVDLICSEESSQEVRIRFMPGGRKRVRGNQYLSSHQQHNFCLRNNSCDKKKQLDQNSHWPWREIIR